MKIYLLVLLLNIFALATAKGNDPFLELRYWQISMKKSLEALPCQDSVCQYKILTDLIDDINDTTFNLLVEKNKNASDTIFLFFYTFDGGTHTEIVGKFDFGKAGKENILTIYGYKSSFSRSLSSCFKDKPQLAKTIWNKHTIEKISNEDLIDGGFFLSMVVEGKIVSKFYKKSTLYKEIHRLLFCDKL